MYNVYCAQKKFMQYLRENVHISIVRHSINAKHNNSFWKKFATLFAARHEAQSMGLIGAKAADLTANSPTSAACRQLEK